MLDIVRESWRRYLLQLQQHPLRTKALTAGVLVGCSDAIAQKILGIKKLQLRRSLDLHIQALWALFAQADGHHFQGYFEEVHTVEEQVRAAAEHKLGVANQSITAGFFDNNTSAEDRREYLESLLRECKKEETASVLGDDALNDLIARSGSEIDIFESIGKHRHEKEMALWQNIQGQSQDASEPVPPMPPCLVTDEDLEGFLSSYADI